MDKYEDYFETESFGYSYSECTTYSLVCGYTGFGHCNSSNIIVIYEAGDLTAKGEFEFIGWRFKDVPICPKCSKKIIDLSNLAKKKAIRVDPKTFQVISKK